MTDAEYGSALIDLVDRAAHLARVADPSATSFECEVSYDELAAMTYALGIEKLRFTRDSGPVLYTSGGVVKLVPLFQAGACGRFVVTAAGAPTALGGEPASRSSAGPAPASSGAAAAAPPRSTGTA